MAIINTVAIKLFLDGVPGVQAGLNNVKGGLGQVGQQAGAASGGADRLSAALGRVAHYGLAGGGLYALVRTAQGVGTALFDASASAQRLSTQLNFATSGRGAQEMAFVSGVAQRLGLELQSTAQAYAGFASAARGTALEGAGARQVFEGIAKASAVMGLSTEQSSGALLAVQQMMSKGVVSAEEFRGQLGERMPIALQAGANALGVTTAEFSKLLETGQIVAQDFLPKFSAAITEMLGDSVEQAANRLDASTARMGNAWDRLKRTVGDSGVSQAIANEATGIGNYLTSITDAMDRAKASGAGMSQQLLTGLGQVIARAPFDALSTAGNLLNGTLNTLSLGALDLNTRINLLPAALDTSAQQALALGRDLVAAEAELKRLKDSGADTAPNFYVRNSYFEALKLTKELRAAKQAQDALKNAASGTGGGRGTVNPATVGELAAQQARLKADADAFLLKQSGVPDSYLKDMTELIRLNQAGAIVGQAYTQALARQQAVLLKKTDTTQGAVAAQKTLQSAYESFLTGLHQKLAAQQQELATGAKVSEADQLRIRLQEMLGTSLKGLGAEQRKVLELGLQELAVGEKLAQQYRQASELANARADARRQESQGIAQWLAEQEAAAQKGLADVRQRINALTMEEDAARLAASTNVSLAEAVELVAIARLQEAQAAKFHEGSEGWKAIEREIAARRELLGLVRGKETREGIKKTADEAEKELKRVTEQYEQGLTNAAMQGGKSLREYIRGMLRTTAFRIVLDPIMKPLAGFLAGATGTGSAAASQGGGVMGTANLLSSAYSALTTGVSSSIAAGFAKLAGSSFGQAIGLSNPGAIVGNNPSAFVPAGGQLTELGQSLSTGLGMLGNGLAGYGISSAISNGYTTGGNTVNVLSGIASAFFGPLAGVVGGLINRAFGRKLKDTGIEGTIGGSAGFEGNSYQFYKGGWLRSDKTVRGDLDAGVDKSLDTAVKQMQLSMAGLATSIGAPTEAISSFSQAIKVSFNGLDEAGIQEKVKEALADYNEGLASAFIASVDRSELPKWVDRLMGNVDASAVERLQAIADYPAKLLQSFGTSRDQLAQLYAEGLARGDTAAAGEAVANSLVASIEASMLGNASAQVFDIVNQGIVTPMLDAIVLGQNVSQALSEASIQKTIARAKETAAAFAELWNNAEFTAALEDIRTTVGSALGQAGSAMEYIPRYTSALTDAAAAARSAEQAERKRIAALHESARTIVETQQGALDALKRSMQEAAIVQRGGMIGSLAVTAQEAEAAQQFTTALGDATGALAELENLGLADELSGYTAEIGKIVQETKSLLATQVASSRLLAGNAQGALDALMSASTLAYKDFMDVGGREGFNAGAFNAQWAKEQARAAQQLGNEASANALRVQDVRSVLGALSQELYSPELLRPVYLGIRDAIVEASGTVGSYVVRDSVDAFARTLAEIQNVQGYQASGPGLASVYAAQRGLAAASTGGFARGQWQMGADVVAYGQALDRLDGALSSGKITAGEYTGALTALNDAAGGAAELLGDVAAQADRAASMQRELGRVGLESVSYYFGSVTKMAADLAAQASAAAEPIALATEAIGRMNSVSAAFGDSARAAISGYGGDDRESRYMLSQMRQEGSSTRDALLVASAAGIAAQVMTTADAARVAQSLATQDAFADMTAAGIRDAALLLDGLSAYDPAAFERSFLRMNAALAAGDLTEQQYTTLYNKALDVFEGADEAARDLADSFKRVTESAIDLADALLRDNGVNTLTAGQTLEEMQRQYAESLAGAQANEAGAYSKYEAVTRAMLDRNLYATTADYEAAFATAVRDSRLLGAMQTAQPGAAAAEEEAKRLRLVGVPAFDVGTNYLPSDMLALVHQGERIVPAADNRELMRLVGGGAVGNEQVLELLRRILQAIESQDGGGSAAGGHPLERTLGSIRRDISDMLNGGLDVVVKNVVQTTAAGA
ncbi:MAG: hypothetical protein A3E01_05430 [Gammaproteobacteria bacterium RIFCSPHIGHO2_12_FULL_63_22]|nr:MAG: hypothetical protein A3E01_05430 [Gammaproteobacteria bacterium RIFCSPHIGHO2_12_FULL_63_22]